MTDSSTYDFQSDSERSSFHVKSFVKWGQKSLICRHMSQNVRSWIYLEEGCFSKLWQAFSPFKDHLSDKTFHRSPPPSPPLPPLARLSFVPLLRFPYNLLLQVSDFKLASLTISPTSFIIEIIDFSSRKPQEFFFPRFSASDWPLAL